MKTKLSQSDLLAIIAATGIVTCASSALAAPDNTAKTPALKVADKTKPATGGGKDNACGKGACGTDEKGAQAAKDRDKKKDNAKADTTKAKADAKADNTKAKADAKDDAAKAKADSKAKTK